MSLINRRKGGAGGSGSGPAGAQGIQGIQGEKGEKGDTGLSGINYVGEYAAATAYAKNDAVAYGGFLWYATAATTGSTPGVGTGWVQVSLQGAEGPQGVQGPQGAVGPAGATGATGPAGASLNSIAYYSYTNIGTGLANMAIPLVSNLVFRVRQLSGTTNIEFSVGNSGIARWVDYEVITSNLGATPAAWTRAAGETTVVQGGGQIIGTNSYQGKGVRRYDITLSIDGDSGKAVAITVLSKGRAGGTTYPMRIKIETFSLT